MKTASVCLAITQSWPGWEQGVQIGWKWCPVFWVTDDGLPGSVVSRGNYSLPLHNIVTFESVLTMKGLAPEITRGQGGRRCSVDDISQARINARDCRGLVLTNLWPESISPDLPCRKSHSFWPLGKENFSFELWSWRKTQCLSLPQGLDVWLTLCQAPWRTIANRAGRSLSSQAYKRSVWHFSYSYNPFSIHRDVTFPFFFFCSFYFVWTSNK